MQSGAISISRSPNLLTINQSSTNAIINWSSFSIAASGTVQINNGGGATLNRVTGSNVSTIDGLLNATGSVYLINPNGIIIGKNGQVTVGGAFVASTQDLSDDQLASARKTFTGSSTATVTNLGSVSALGGDVVLIANTVRNYGSIYAPNGDVGLLAGSSVLIRDMATDDGKFAVQVGGPGTSVVNEGYIQAAMAELRANQGNVYALAGNTTSVINATGVSTKDRNVFLVAEDGDVVAHGVINATLSDGAGGDILTSGANVNIAGANFGANAGAANWTIQEDKFVLTPTAAATLSAELLWNNITIQTLGSNNGATTTGGDINLASSLDWSGSNSLTLSAFHNIVFQDGVTLSNNGGAGIALAADNKGRGLGTVVFNPGASVSTSGDVTIFYNPAGIDSTSVNSSSYTDPTDFTGNVSAGSLTSYMLVNSVYSLQNIENNLSGNYALGRNINAFVAAGWNGGGGFTPIGTSFYSDFTGTFNGLDHYISNLTINGSAQFEGLFGLVNGGAVENLTLKSGNINVTGSPSLPYSATGGLIGLDDGGAISNVASSATVSGTGITYLGGLIGWIEGGSVSGSTSGGVVSGVANYVGGLTGAISYGTLTGSSSSGSVSGSGGSSTGGVIGSAFGGLISNNWSTATVAGTDWVGGFVGLNDATISDSFATGSIQETIGAGAVGGFAGINEGSITASYASGAVIGTNTTGGFVGWSSGAITNAYSTGSVTGPSAGGFAGSNFQGGVIRNVYASGAVSGGAGLIGWNDAQIYNAYWDEGTTGQSRPILINDGAAINVTGIGGSTNLNAFSQSTYANFDFGPGGSWTIIEGVSRPTLTW